MPLPRAVARFNTRYTNRFIEPRVARLPGFVVVEHTGRSSGTHYRTPLYAFGSADKLFIALTYGPNTDWAQNLMHGEGTVERHGSTLAVVSSAIVTRPVVWPHLPLIVRAGLRVLTITDFVQIDLQ